MKKVLFVVLAAFGGGIVALASFRAFDNANHRTSLEPGRTLPVQQTSYASGGGITGPDFVDAAAKSVHAVVHIKTEYQQKSTTYDNFFNNFFGYDNRGARPYVATGSGVILTKDGYIVTNNHVVQDADYIEVTLNDKRSFEAKIIGTDPSTDIALIKVTGNELPFVTFANSDNVKVGEWVLAVGNPFNLTSTVTAGIVSAKARNINILGKENSIESFIQTDAVVNPGNSGGALVNVSGDLIGINAAIASNTGSYAGYSFAIPSNIAKKVVEDLMQYGNVQRGYIGVTPADITADFAREQGLDVTRGVYVYGVSENGSANQAGIKKGDIITNINSQSVNSVSEMLEAIGQHRPGETINVTYSRDGKDRNVSLLLKNKEGTTSIVTKETVDVGDLLGASFIELNKDEKSWLRLDGGIKVKALKEGLLANAGIRENFIITSIDKKIVKNQKDIEEVLTDKKGGVLVEGIYPNRMRAWYLVVLK
jgi:Do/DeqQ family serine protease